MTLQVMQQVIEMVYGKKASIWLHCGNWRKNILEHIEPDDLNITGVYDEELQEIHNNEE